MHIPKFLFCIENIGKLQNSGTGRLGSLSKIKIYSAHVHLWYSHTTTYGSCGCLRIIKALQALHDAPPLSFRQAK